MNTITKEQAEYLVNKIVSNNNNYVVNMGDKFFSFNISDKYGKTEIKVSGGRKADVESGHAKAMFDQGSINNDGIARPMFQFAREMFDLALEYVLDKQMNVERLQKELSVKSEVKTKKFKI